MDIQAALEDQTAFLPQTDGNVRIFSKRGREDTSALENRSLCRHPYVRSFIHKNLIAASVVLSSNGIPEKTCTSYLEFRKLSLCLGELLGH